MLQQEIFNNAVIDNNILLVKSLLDDLMVDPTYNKNKAISIAAKEGFFEIFKLLLNDQRVNPIENDNYIIKTSCLNGHTDIVELILNDKRVSPNYVISAAAKRGHIDIVKLLLKDERVDPSCLNNAAIRNAEQNFHREISTLLFRHQSVKDLLLLHNKTSIYNRLQKEDIQTKIEEF